MNFIKQDNSKAVACHADESRSLEICNFKIKQQFWSLSRVEATRLARTPHAALPPIMQDWNLYKKWASKVYANFPQICEETRTMEHIDVRTADLWKDVGTMYGFWTGFYAFRFWRHIVPLEEQRNEEHVRHVALLCMALEGVNTVMQVRLKT